MRCKACDNRRGVRYWKEDFYCQKCRLVILETIDSDRMVHDHTFGWTGHDDLFADKRRAEKKVTVVREERESDKGND